MERTDNSDNNEKTDINSDTNNEEIQLLDNLNSYQNIKKKDINELIFN